jgi:hypothetical protein
MPAGRKKYNRIVKLLLLSSLTCSQKIWLIPLVDDRQPNMEKLEKKKKKTKKTWARLERDRPAHCR